VQTITVVTVGPMLKYLQWLRALGARLILVVPMIGATQSTVVVVPMIGHMLYVLCAKCFERLKHNGVKISLCENDDDDEPEVYYAQLTPPLMYLRGGQSPTPKQKEQPGGRQCQPAKGKDHCSDGHEQCPDQSVP
jgi:hypothetical protein